MTLGKAHKAPFTIMELIAVITITAILLTVALRVMKTDTTKANAVNLASALNSLKLMRFQN
jgi:type II secretory pathway pseudopilin PulG